MISLERAFYLFTGASVIGSFTQVLKGKLSAVLLGADGLGILNQLTNVWSLFSVIAGMGFYNGMVRHMAMSWGEEDRETFRIQTSTFTLFLLGTSLTIALLGCIFSGTMSIYVFHDGGERAELICLILVSIPIFAMGQVYRAMLNATRSVTWMVRARIYTDLLSVVILATLIWPFGLVGAIIGYIALHLLFLFFTILFTRRAIGSDVIVPDPKRFEWSQVRGNTGFGVNGLISVAVGIITTIIVSSWIISDLSMADNGIFNMALKVATVYLGGLSAAAGGYYFPTLADAKTDLEMYGHIDHTLSLYLYIIPPIIVVLMAGGDLMMMILFSREFVPAAVLLLLILPGDLFRITAETVGLPLVAKKRLVLSTSLYASWAVLYLGLVYWMLPIYGLLGVAAAYLISQSVNAVVKLIAVRIVLKYKMSAECLRTLLLGLGLVGGAAGYLWFSQDRWIGYGVSTVLLMMWFGISLLDPDFARLTRKVISKVR